MRCALLLPFLLISVAALGADLDGAYERVSLTNTRTGESPEAENREGVLIMAHGHYAMMTQNPERRVLTRDEQALLDDREEIAFLREWLDVNAHSGRYEATASELTWYRDISEDPKEVGTTTTLDYRIEGEMLVLSFTLPNGDRYDWVWRRRSNP